MISYNIFIKDIRKCVIKKDTPNLDSIIQAYLNERGISKSVEEWKAENANTLREWALSITLPPVEEVLYTILKTFSDNQAIANTAVQQIKDWLPSCGEVVAEFPHNTPQVAVIEALVTRQVGYLGNLGWRMDFTFSDPEYTPSNVAIAVYSAAGCTGYLYTTGALQFDGTNYFTECPPGQEPGDVNIHFGLLYASLNMSCFTLPAGVSNQLFEVYNSSS